MNLGQLNDAKLDNCAFLYSLHAQLNTILGKKKNTDTGCDRLIYATKRSIKWFSQCLAFVLSFKTC